MILLIKRIAIFIIVIFAIISFCGAKIFYDQTKKLTAKASELNKTVWETQRENIRLKDGKNSLIFENEKLGKENSTLKTGNSKLAQNGEKIANEKNRLTLKNKELGKKNNVLEANNFRLAQKTEELSEENIGLLLETISNEATKNASTLYTDSVVSIAAKLQDKTSKITKKDLRLLVQESLKIEIPIKYNDGFYYYVPIEEWKRILENDKTDEITPIRDKRDCDDFENTLKSQINTHYALNGIGTVIGTKEGHKHAWNIILVENNGKPTLFFLEPQTDDLGEAHDETVMDGKLYIPEEIAFHSWH